MQHLSFNKKVRALNLLKVERLKRLLFIKWYSKKILLRSVFSNIKLTPQQRMYVIFKLSLFSRYSNIIQHNTRCFKTGRSHMSFRFSLLCRMHIKLNAKLGYLPHVGKAML